MTSLEIYLLVAPLVIAAAGWGVAIWWVKRGAREDERAKQSGPR